MKRPSIRQQWDAVKRAVVAAPSRSSQDIMHRDHLNAAAATLLALDGLTTAQIEWLLQPEAQELVRATYEASKSGGVVMRNIGGAA